ncbi:MAG TPA: DUF4388 domain-containing protein [Candidatus Eisenbacteria bacterium]|nr:DUF4388 domain-containing protein [Candidatus Eisenbacteria bacterium]
MALQGNLRDFSVTEILQLLGSQKKSGCLKLEWNTERAQIHVTDGRITGTRSPGMKSEDPLLHFLLKVHRLSDEQRRGLLSIHKESNRDLEDLLVNGRYLESDELKAFIERQILNDLMRIVRWESGSYRFEPKETWPTPPLVRLSMEGALIEAARRVDEQKRFIGKFKNPYDLLGVRDLPDPDEPLTEEEKELFGIIDGQHTVAEVVEAAPLAEYEAYEALDRMLDANWIEVVGRREPGAGDAARRILAPPPAHTSVPREVMVAGLVLAVAVGLHFGARVLQEQRQDPEPANDVFAAVQVEQLRSALDLYRRENGRYPKSLGALVDDDWVGDEQTRVRGYKLGYQLERGGDSYRITLDPDR